MKHSRKRRGGADWLGMVKKYGPAVASALAPALGPSAVAAAPLLGMISAFGGGRKRRRRRGRGFYQTAVYRPTFGVPFV